MANPYEVGAGTVALTLGLGLVEDAYKSIGNNSHSSHLENFLYVGDNVAYAQLFLAAIPVVLVVGMILGSILGPGGGSGGTGGGGRGGPKAA